MARQGLHQHRKFLRLSRMLGATYIARGILEMMWEPAYDSGDDFLGDAEDIAARCGWTGSAADLVRALMESEFIDEDQDRPGHYRIHDLFDHAPESVTKRAKREADRMTRGKTLAELRAEAGRKGMKSRWADNKRITSDNKRLTKVATHYTPHTTQIEASLRDAPSAPPQPKKKEKKEKAPHPRHTPLKAKLVTGFREATGTDYGFQGGKDAKGIDTLLGICPDDEEIVSRWRTAWGRSGYQRPKDISDFASKWNLYGLPDTKPSEFEKPRPDPNGGIMRGTWEPEAEAWR